MRRYGKTLGLLFAITMITGCETMVGDCPTQAQGVADGQALFELLLDTLALDAADDPTLSEFLQILQDAESEADQIRRAPEGQCLSYDQGINTGVTGAFLAFIAANPGGPG